MALLSSNSQSFILISLKNSWKAENQIPVTKKIFRHSKKVCRIKQSAEEYGTAGTLPLPYSVRFLLNAAAPLYL